MICKRLIGQAFQQRAVFAKWQRFRGVATARILDDKWLELSTQKPHKNDETMRFPSVWLRDNCQCSECFHAHTRSRKANWTRTDLNVRPIKVQSNEKEVTVYWQDNHKSVFELNWLLARSFNEKQRNDYIQEVYRPAPQLWSKVQYKEILRTFQYEAVLLEDEVLRDWLEVLSVQGFAILKNAPADPAVVRHLAERIGFIKRTTYGEVFEVKSKPNAKNYAYLMTPLPLHTDLPYYEYKAGINILHCMVQSSSTGGANTLTDGFYIADQLRQHYPDYFNILRTTQVNWYDIGRDGNMDFHSLWRAPVICLNGDGQYARINQNTTKRDSHFTVPLEQVIPWYEAYDKFLQLAENEAVEFKTTPGDVFVFNNLRMLHGRTAYEDSADNKRHLIGAYVDWDIIYSKWRTLKYPRA